MRADMLRHDVGRGQITTLSLECMALPAFSPIFNPTLIICCNLQLNSANCKGNVLVQLM